MMWDFEIVARLALASVMSHGGETPTLFAYYSDVLRLAKARVFKFKSS